MSNRLVRVLISATVALTLVAGKSSVAMAQRATVITGRIVGETGAPIQDATVTLAATKSTALSKADGSYSLTAAASNTGTSQLTARRIGFAMLQKDVTLSGGPVRMDFTLVARQTVLTGITVTALGILAEKTTVGTSQQTLSGESLTHTQTPSVISAMSGNLSGVQIDQTGNMGGSSRIVIRGAGSITGENQPLFIVDGVPYSNASFSTASAGGGRDYGTAAADINPDDIASLTVLKGPNAAALYGSRAANGAVVITTKTGRGGPEGTKFSFTTRMSTDMPAVMPKYQNKYGQGFGGAFQYVDGAGGGTNDGADESWGPKLDGRLIDQFFGKQQPWVAHPNNVTDYFQSGSTVSNTVNVSTAGKGMGSRFSLTKDNVRGLVPNSSLSKLSGSVSASATINSKFSVAGSLQYVQNNGQNRAENGYTEGNPFMTFTWFGRQVDVNGLLKNHYFNTSSPYGFADGSLFNWNDNYHRNPYWQQFDNPAPDSRERVTGQINGTYVFSNWLSGVVRGGGDSYRFSRQEQFAAGNIDRTDPSFNGGFNAADQRAKETNFEGILTAHKSVGRFELTANAGGNIRRNDGANSSFGTPGILVPGIYNLSNAGVAPTFTNGESHSGVNSVYGSAVATINHYWTVEVTGRNDWSSTLPKANSSYFYPSVNTSLVLSDVFPSITKSNVISFLKIRGGFAKVGSDAGPYQLQTLYNGSSNKFNGLPLYTLSNTSANAALKPERTESAEGGLEASFFDDRITFDGTYFLKLTRNQILPLTIAPATGFQATTINAGQLSNRGYEAMLRAIPVRLNGFQWSTSVNFAVTKNKVDALAPGLKTIVLGGTWGTNIEARQGQPYGILFGYDALRDPATGQVLLADGLPQRAKSKSILGNVIPDWTGGWSNEIRYKNVALSTLIDIHHGGQNFSVGNWWGTYSGVLSNTLKGREVDWNNPGYVAKGIDQATGKANAVVVTAEDYNHAIYPINSMGVFGTGFAKLREVRLSYDVPQRFAASLKLSQLNVALVGRNLYTWTSFPNYDPENSSSAGNSGQGFDMGALPTMRSYGVNITITP